MLYINKNENELIIPKYDQYHVQKYNLRLLNKADNTTYRFTCVNLDTTNKIYKCKMTQDMLQLPEGEYIFDVDDRKVQGLCIIGQYKTPNHIYNTINKNIQYNKNDG